MAPNPDHHHCLHSRPYQLVDLHLVVGLHPHSAPTVQHLGKRRQLSSNSVFFRVFDSSPLLLQTALLDRPQGHPAPSEHFPGRLLDNHDFCQGYCLVVRSAVCRGAADVIMYAVLPMCLGEVTTPKIRGTWGNGQTFSFNAGFFVMSATGSFLTIQTTACVFLSLPVLFTALFMWMPESPYYFIAKGRDAKARSSLQFLLRKKNVNEEFQSLKKDVDRQVSETGTWRDLWMIRSNRRALIACVFLRWAQQLAGIAVFETYFQFIFQKAGPTALTPQGSALFFSGALWLAMTGFSFTLDKLGRRKSFVFSALGCALCLTAESCYFFIDEFRPGLDLASFSWFPIAGLLLYSFFYAFGLDILPSLMAGELFSASIKAKGLAVANVFMGVICFFTATIFKTLSNELGLYAPFALFALCTFGSCALSLSIVPETRGRTLEEIQQDLKGARKF
ncbi:hypothetical protein HUJ04_005323 [Dendroctonus ponderosae]|nr:hypothetical protein HUJ04_005322 [Dendroctonus ponderosae]KAH0999454.1 hypothetical protein HUJ04_005323 [Dendroctonus ponderosae]